MVHTIKRYVWYIPFLRTKKQYIPFFRNGMNVPFLGIEMVHVLCTKKQYVCMYVCMYHFFVRRNDTFLRTKEVSLRTYRFFVQRNGTFLHTKKRYDFSYKEMVHMYCFLYEETVRGEKLCWHKKCTVSLSKETTCTYHYGMWLGCHVLYTSNLILCTVYFVCMSSCICAAHMLIAS